jgi:thymidylate synthase (FAD)
MTDKIDVLDHGFVRLVDVLGDELRIISAARASFNKETQLDENGDLTQADQRLLKYLIKNKHWSPFRQCALTFQVRAPILVSDQWWKHAVASSFVEDQLGYNRNSLRYITDDFEFYVPAADQWRSAPENKKQGSAEPLPSLTSAEWENWQMVDYDPISFDLMPEEYGNLWTEKLNGLIAECLNIYSRALDYGLAPEQARLFLPYAGLYVNFYWTTSLQALLNFLDLRTKNDSQWEIRQYAQAVYELTEPKFPYTIKEFVNG